MKLYLCTVLNAPEGAGDLLEPRIVAAWDCAGAAQAMKDNVRNTTGWVGVEVRVYRIPRNPVPTEVDPRVLHFHSDLPLKGDF